MCTVTCRFQLLDIRDERINRTLAGIQETLLVDIPEEEPIPIEEFVQRTEVSVTPCVVVRNSVG